MTGVTAVYTFKGLFEHQTWHYQVYAVNEDATGEVGTSNPVRQRSPLAPTTAHLASTPLRRFGRRLTSRLPANLAVLGSSRSTPAGAPVDRLPDPGPAHDRH